ncbi:hypothetical protein Aperf_G00000088190 [Anoplocephala perfoliata]
MNLRVVGVEDASHHSPVQWPAIRPGLSSDKDINTLSPKLFRSGSQETTPAVSGGPPPGFTLAAGPSVAEIDFGNIFHLKALKKLVLGMNGEPPQGFTHSMASGRRCRHTSLNIRVLGDTSVGSTDRLSSNEGSVLQRHPDLRYKISYLGVWPSHQMELQHALKSVHQALHTYMPRIINSAILSCHKNLLWYRLFDSQYFPSSLQTAYQEGIEEIGQEAISFLTPKVIHRGLSCEEFGDLISSAPLKLDLLKMDPRLMKLLKISGKYLTTSVVNHLNANGNATAAFLFTEASETDSKWTHLVVIDPTFREGLIQISWRKREDYPTQISRVVTPQPVEQMDVQSPRIMSKFSSVLKNILSSVDRTVEGVPVGEQPEESEDSWESYEFTMTAVFRSMGSMEASMRSFSTPSVTPSTSSSGAPNFLPLSNIPTAANIHRTHLMPALKLIVEVLTLHLWNDLH